jgi:hypothetical protein
MEGGGRLGRTGDVHRAVEGCLRLEVLMEVATAAGGTMMEEDVGEGTTEDMEFYGRGGGIEAHNDYDKNNYDNEWEEGSGDDADAHGRNDQLSGCKDETMTASTRNWAEKKVKMKKKGGYDFSRMKKSSDANHINKTNGVVITEFNEGKGTFLTPWGQYAIELYDAFLQMQGGIYDHKIWYDDISSLFLLPRQDAVHMAFVIALNRPIQEGQQR